MDLDEVLLPDSHTLVREEHEAALEAYEEGTLTAALGASGKPTRGTVFNGRKRQREGESCHSFWSNDLIPMHPTYL